MGLVQTSFHGWWAVITYLQHLLTRLRCGRNRHSTFLRSRKSWIWQSRWDSTLFAFICISVFGLMMKRGSYKRMDQFLDVCKKRGITPWFVFFDDCHNPEWKLGPQPLPVAKWHNSGWLACPSKELAKRFSAKKETPEEYAQMKAYVLNTIRHFKDDKRVLMWELTNETRRGFASGTLPADLSGEFLLGPRGQGITTDHQQ